MTHLLWVIDWMNDGRGFPCLFHFITGFYCPGCGGTRAVRCLLRGDVLRSFCFHPFVLYACFAAVAEFCFLLWEMVRGRIKKQSYGAQEANKGKNRIREYGKGFHRRYGRWVLGALWVVGVNWVVKNGFLLAGVDLLVMLGE